MYFQSAITHGKQFVTAPLTKYVFNYVSEKYLLWIKDKHIFFYVTLTLVRYFFLSFKTLHINTCNITKVFTMISRKNECLLFTILNFQFICLVQILFFVMLVIYSAFVLTSISTKYYVQDTAKILEYYVYFWGFGDFIEELISCFVSV